jgi:two-component system, response regulator PdtaR
MMRIVAGQDDDPTRRSIAGSGPAENRDGDAPSLLVVEDEWLVSLEIEAALQEAGYEVVGIAASADEAVSMVAMYRPALILMDIRLQGDADGIEAATQIRRRWGTRCIFITANADPGTRERGAAADPVGWLAKPFSSPQLLLHVERALEALGE